MNHLATETTIRLDDTEGFLDELCGHLSEHDVQVTRSGESSRLEFQGGVATLKSGGKRLHIRAESPHESDLFYMRMVLSSHIVELAPGASDFVWTGHGTEATTPPNFRLMTVKATTLLTPHMRRLTLAGENLAWFDADDMHVRLLIPPAGVAPEWPRLNRHGLIDWPAGEKKLRVRKYTIRRIDVAAGELDIDFVVHEDAGPGSDFAAAARVGDVIGMAGPGGGGCRTARWTLLAGDETALPAMARIIEAMPANATGVAFIEVADRAEEQEIRAPRGVEIRWLHRNGAEPGTTSLLFDAVTTADWPSESEELFAWVACEFDAFRKIRAYLRKERKLGRDQHLAVAYWRRGENEDSFAKTKHQH